MSWRHVYVFSIIIFKFNLQLLLTKVFVITFFSLTYFNFFPQVYTVSSFAKFFALYHCFLTSLTSFSHKVKHITGAVSLRKNFIIQVIALCNHLVHIPALFMTLKDFLTASVYNATIPDIIFIHFFFLDPSVNKFSEKLVNFYCSSDCICITLVKFVPNIGL